MPQNTQPLSLARRGLLVCALAAASACSAGHDAVIPTTPGDDASASADAARDSGPSIDAPRVDVTAPDAVTPPDAVRPDGAAGDGAPGDGASGREMCNNGLDDDGNGMVDEGCPCVPGTDQPCYPRAAAEVGRGPCMRGRQGCEGSGEFGSWTECVGAVVPTSEVCGDGVDQDCSGTVDDGAMCQCRPGASEACYAGPTGTGAVGICRAGHRECEASGTRWGACLDEVLPRAELCANRLDDDCNGVVDDGPACACPAGTTRACYPGPMSEVNVGVCRAGRQVCNGGGTAWGACAGAVGPMMEVCGNGLDDDCDGTPDDSCPPPPRECMVTVNLNGDCLTTRCPAECPFPIGCSITMAGDDDRGCVANASGSPVVYFQEGNSCGAGRVTGTLRCSSARGAALNATNCPINKTRRYYPTSRSGCPT